MENRLKVLVVEDDSDLQDAYRMSLEHLVDVVTAGSISSAMTALRREKKFSLIILDGNVPRRDNEPLMQTTVELAQHISFVLGIPMISASGDEKLNDILVCRGCIRADKFTAVQEAERFLAGINAKIT